MALVPMSISFLDAPRELRDIIYRHLLSTKYTKNVFGEPQVDSMKQEYLYQFHPSILRANKQIEREASHVLYTENLLVRIKSNGQCLSESNLSAMRGGHAVPIVARDAHAETFTRHAMELRIFGNDDLGFDKMSYPSHFENCFVFASDDIPRFSWALVVEDLYWDQKLSRTTLMVEVRHGQGASNNQGGTYTGNRNYLENRAYGEDETNHGHKESTGRVNSINRSQTFSNHQICRLLEPLCRLHSLHAVQIQGDVGEQFKAELQGAMCGDGPCDEQLFYEVSAMFEDAMVTYKNGRLSSAVTKMKYTLDTIKDYKQISPSMSYRSPRISDAWQRMQFTMWMNLGWASLKNRDNHDDVWNAYRHVQTLIRNYVDDNGEYENAPSGMGHQVAMIFYLWAKVAEALDDLGNDDPLPRSFYLEEIVRYLREALRHEPENILLREQFKRREDELQKAVEVEDLMEIADRIYERGLFASSGSYPAISEVGSEDGET